MALRNVPTLSPHMTVDRRIRVDGEPASTEPAQLLEAELPRLFAEAADRLHPSIQEMQPRPLTITVDGRSWTLRAVDARIGVTRGPAEGSVLRIDAEQLDALVADKVTPMRASTARSVQERPSTVMVSGRGCISCIDG